MPPRLPPLLCPVCRKPLSPLPAENTAPPRIRALACAGGHSFDAARQGYFNLLVGKGTSFEADTADMVAARTAFLDAGHYRPLADAVAGAAKPALQGPHPALLDSGTGTGHYLRAILDLPFSEVPAAVGLDISKFALRRAARLNPEAVNMVCDIWQPLPVADASIDVVTVVFAPRNAAEFSRVLRPGGRLVVVTPRPGHLQDIAGQTGMLGIEPAKEERLAESLAGYFELLGAEDLDLDLELSPEDVANAAMMGPAGHHIDRATLNGRLAGFPAPTPVSARFKISVFSPARQLPM
ncbi:methyltransferase domain-containing protein [Arthrobacter sp. D1-17]